MTRRKIAPKNIPEINLGVGITCGKDVEMLLNKKSISVTFDLQCIALNAIIRLTKYTKGT